MMYFDFSTVFVVLTFYGVGLYSIDVDIIIIYGLGSGGTDKYIKRTSTA